MSDEFDGRFNERLLDLTQDAFNKLGFQLFDPTGEPSNCLQNLVKESLKSGKGPKEPKQPEPQQPAPSESCSGTKENLTSQLNLQLEQAGDMHYRISNLLAIIESHEKNILSLRSEYKTINDQNTPLGQRATEMKQTVYEKAKAEQSSMQQEDERWIKKQAADSDARSKNPRSKTTETLLQRKDREFQLLCAFFKYIVTDLTKRRNVNRLELAADLRGIRQALQLLLDQSSPGKPATTKLERQSSKNQQQTSSACSVKAEQKYSSTTHVAKRAPSQKAQGSRVNVSIESERDRTEGPSTSSGSSMLKNTRRGRQVESTVKPEIKSERAGSPEVIEIVDDDDDD